MVHVIETPSCNVSICAMPSTLSVHSEVLVNCTNEKLEIVKCRVADLSNNYTQWVYNDEGELSSFTWDEKND